MENQRSDSLVHDVSLPAAQHCMETVASLLREEERIIAREEFYHIIKAAIEVYDLQRQRMLHRLNPLEN